MEQQGFKPAEVKEGSGHRPKEEAAEDNPYWILPPGGGPAGGWSPTGLAFAFFGSKDGVCSGSFWLFREAVNSLQLVGSELEDRLPIQKWRHP